MRSVFVLILLMAVIETSAQDCTKLFHDVTQKLERDRTEASSKGFSMAFVVRVSMNDGKIHTQEMEVAMKGKKYMYSTKTMHLYQDEKASVVVNGVNNSILITKPDANISQSLQYQQIEKMQDSIASYFDVRSCSKEWGLVDKDMGYYKLVLSPKEKLKNMGVTSIVYAVTVDKMEVRRIQIFYDPARAEGIKEYDMVIKKRNETAIQSPFSGTAIGIVMEKDKLKSSYSNYSLIDKRN